jgi:nicotinic acid mononucleotide adenylyltransferase
MAAEARESLGPAPEIALVLGRDAAERIANWDYGPENPNAFMDLLRDYQLLVASRAGEYEPPSDHRHRIVPIPFAPHDDISSTEVRRRVAAGENWQHLIPTALAEEVARIYGMVIIP